jgi:hypothetical protein
MQGVKSPTNSEFATFQVLANKEFVNLSKTILPPSSPTPASHHGLNLPGIIEENDSYHLKQSNHEDGEKNEKLISSARIKTFSQNNIAMNGIEGVFDVDDVNEEEEHTMKENVSSASSTSSSYSKDESSTQKHEQKEESRAFPMSSGNPLYETKFRSPYRANTTQHPGPFASTSQDYSNPPFFKNMRQAYEKSENDMNIEIEAEKEGLLAELANMERQGLYKTVKPLSMADSLEEIQFQYDRAQSEINANQIVDFAKTAIKMGSGMVEMVMKKAGIKVIDGYHTNLCKDMTKFNRPLNRIYKKYWRRGGLSAEAELGLLFITPLAWTVIQNKIGSLSGAVGASMGVSNENESGNNTMNNNMPSSSSNNNFDAAGKNHFSTPHVVNSMKPPQMSALNIPSSWGGFHEGATTETKKPQQPTSYQHTKKKQNAAPLDVDESEVEDDDDASDASSESDDNYNKKKQSPPKRIITLKNSESSKGIGGGPASGSFSLKKKSATLSSAQRKKKLEGEVLEI